VRRTVLAVGLCTLLGLVVLGLQARGGSHQAAQRPDYPFQPVAFPHVRLHDAFWAPRIETNRTVTIPVAFGHCERTGRVDLFVRAAKVLAGEPLDDRRPPGYPFDDSDVFKIIEGASYTLSVVPDPKLDAYLDDLIEKIAAAQEPDGYLYTTRTINPAEPHRWAGPQRWVLERDDSHELYNLGHLFEAAVAHHLATRKTTLLNVAIKAADLLVETFGPGKRSTWPGHQVTEMALVRLYGVTANETYLALATFLLHERGPGPDPRNPTEFPGGERANPRGLEYNQAHAPVVQQSEPVGHAVRAMYMYAAMADVAALNRDDAMRRAGLRIWNNLVESKLYVTGGIGAAGGHEGFGHPYDLPNLQAYNETCASVGMDYWNHRLFLLEGDAKYIDVMERTLFNGLVSGVALDGQTFFYPNPLESNGRHARQEWFGVACCPSNITRFMASLPGYLYAKRGDTLYVNLFAAGAADIDLNGRNVTVVQDTRYPWDGTVTLIVTPDEPRTFTIRVRIPGWARDEVVPSNLYRFIERATESAALEVNGTPVTMALDKGYVGVTRTWQRGDTLTLRLPMPVRRVLSHDKVDANRGRVALQRGPIVFAAEWPDNPGGRVRSIVLPDDATLTSEFRPDLLNGVQVINGRAVGLALDEKGTVQKHEQPFMAIPYAMWANRGRGEMAVWLARTEAAGRPAAFPTIAMASTLTASRTGQGYLPLIVEGDEPPSSSDATSMFNWWPVQGWRPECDASPAPGQRQPPACSKTEWIEMAFAQPATVSQAEVYWFDDTGRGGVRVPASWRMFYRDGAEWTVVDTSDAFGVARDSWNRVTFRPVTTSALRLEVVMQPGFSAGVQEWSVR
jgi:uncharacterized protein